MNGVMDMLNVECRLHTIDGLAKALSMVGDAPDLQPDQRDALHALSGAIEEQHRALWCLLFPGDTSMD